MYTHKTSGFKTSGFKTSGFKTSETSGLQNVWFQNVRFTKRHVTKRLVSKRPVFKFDIVCHFYLLLAIMVIYGKKPSKIENKTRFKDLTFCKPDIL